MLESRKRIIIILAITVAVEIGLAIAVKLGPALEYLAQPVYVIVAGIGAVTAWQAARRHRGSDRRHADRRHPE
jgi:hypothetical protein